MTAARRHARLAMVLTGLIPALGVSVATGPRWLPVLVGAVATGLAYTLWADLEFRAAAPGPKPNPDPYRSSWGHDETCRRPGDANRCHHHRHRP